MLFAGASVNLRNDLSRYFAGLFGLGWYIWLGGLRTLNPANLDWLMIGDWRQHLLGWLFFRREPWTFPLGTLTAVPYPVGSTIGYTDSNPLVAILLKPFSGLLPVDFQFIGPWLALCFMMQGYFGAALAGTVTKKPVQQMFGGFLFVLSPVLAARLVHDTLCAQWLLLGLLYFSFREYSDAVNARRAARLCIVLATLAAAIHPYLAVMSAVLACACFVRFWRTGWISAQRAMASVVLMIALMLGVMFAIGYFIDARGTMSGFGRFAADLVSLVDGAGYSKVWRNFDIQGGRWEGFGFLGIGIIAGAALAVIASLRTRPRLPRGTGIVIAACVLMAVYSLSDNVTFKGDTVARLNQLYDPIANFTQRFRASGRFIWPLHYLVALWVIWGITRVFGLARGAQWAATAVLATLTAVQALDYNRQGTTLEARNFRQASADLMIAKGRYRHVAILPQQINDACGPTSDENRVYRYMLLAYRLNMTFNSGYYARVAVDRAQVACADLSRSVDAGELDPKTIYVPSPSMLPRLKALGAACGQFDEDWICVSRDSDEVFRTYVTTR